MAFLGRARKEILLKLGAELGIEVSPEMTIIVIKKAITESEDYEEEFVKEMMTSLITARKEEMEKEEREREEERRKEEREEERRKEEREDERQKREHELEVLRLQQGVSSEARVTQPENQHTKFELQRILPKFNLNEDDISMFLLLFERQMKFFKIPEEMWISYLIGVLPTEITKLIAREPEEKAQEYTHIRTILLHRFKLTADRFRKLFSQHRKTSDHTWTDYYFELRNYFEGWITELEVTTFQQLSDLVLADQMKKRCSQECKEHFLDEWEELISPRELADKLDAYDSLRHSIPEKQKKSYDKVKAGSAFQKNGPFKKSANFPNGDQTKPQQEERPALRCYGCGTPGYLKSRCPNCSLVKKEEVRANSIQMYTCFTSPPPTTLLDISIFEAVGAVCADTGASRSIGGQVVYDFLKKRGQQFQERQVTMSLADGQQTTTNVLTSQVPIRIKRRTITIELIFLPHVKGNRTLLGMDFLRKAGIGMELRNDSWYFCDNPGRKFSFSKEVPDPDHPAGGVEFNSCLLRTEEGVNLTEAQRVTLNTFLQNRERCFQPGGEATPFIQHHINTGDHPPVAVPPYRLTPAKKEILRKELDDLLQKGIVEECESPYASPVVLVPKPNGTVRLCVDYRKLNANTIPDTYPLPRMDDLWHDAKSTAFMTTIDLRSGYHQVEIFPPDKDKTAFVCSFGTYRFNRMSFGLRNAPASFQRLMDSFRNGLPSIKILTYLDDIIILSPTFEQHIQDLENVFDRLEKFKLNVNREKCNFACSRVKYLGLWITPEGIQTDPEKTSAILHILAPRNVKQTQSFLQTCSWYRKFIPNFAEISRPLSNLTKKCVEWKWGEKEQHAFETLKQCLVSPPILKQADEMKPFVIRTDASNYALGAVLLQGEGKNDEHPIEYASRLLSSAERNYSTTEREALAVVWALNKFRGYVEGSEVTVATDHQPLKWLMSLKSPSGRLARWALQLQSYNLKVEYIPGKCNVMADMLSRPVCHSEEPPCEISTISIDLPSKNPKDIREDQLKDSDLKKIIDCFETVDKGVDFANWTERGYIMNKGILYRYAPDSEAEEAQLVIPSHERENIMKEHHDAPTAGHYGMEGTFDRISKRYYWTGMRAYITEYVKRCAECNRYKASNQKPAGLLQTPIYSQRFETLSIDLFGPLPESSNGKKWIFIVEDCATKWVEIFALANATAKECAIILMEEVILRYGLPRRLISDNGSQFVSGVMQQLCCLLGIKQSLIPVYHPQANMVERKNRDLKPRLAILVGTDHTTWDENLPTIRFAMNTAKCDTTGQTASFLQFGREMRTTDDINHDIRSVIDNDNFVPEITPYLKKFSRLSREVKERMEMKQDQRKKYADRRRRQGPQYVPGDKVFVTLHPVSKAAKKKTAKFMPKRDGPYLILTQKSPSTYEIASLDKPCEPKGVYHESALTQCQDSTATPISPLRKQGRPPRASAGSLPGRLRNQRGRM